MAQLSSVLLANVAQDGDVATARSIAWQSTAKAGFSKPQMARHYFAAKATQVALFATTLFSASAALATTYTYPQSPGPTPVSDLYNYQYCEVLIDVPSSTQGKPVFNTTGYDDCPNYSTLTAEAIVKAYNEAFPAGNTYNLPAGAVGILKDWPRNWVYDSASESPVPGTLGYYELNVPNVPDYTTFGFVAFNTNITGNAYIPSDVQRNATWTYNAGNLIYQLTDPSNNLYVMQSYARFINPSLTIDDLQNVAYMNSILDLPTGWTYSVARLTQEFQNISTGNAYLIQDAVGDSYMQLVPGVSQYPVTTPYPAPAPGPLPIFGVGMALGFSRRLRARIKKASV